MSRQKYYINRDRRIRREYKELIEDSGMQKTEAKHFLAMKEGLDYEVIRKIVEE